MHQNTELEFNLIESRGMLGTILKDKAMGENLKNKAIAPWGKWMRSRFGEDECDRILENVDAIGRMGKIGAIILAGADLEGTAICCLRLQSVL
ncbi:hypothetical protein [Coleofasciculus sp. FACHB-1120]|uniref:hypothetical protein n=1 Tax=Coleofasciculus sp. FACHB-1120 TaxID=2692783 RepID=UPI0016898C9A|nr:hypothetical protein [Coleofasciculus sp. FACHB-1120]MBD2743193.1 hypothetical protein [Coleofasciculus sp. FACHB-1120]